jgi:hypothetical protein
MRLDEYQIANALIDTRLVMTSRLVAKIRDDNQIHRPMPVSRYSSSRQHSTSGTPWLRNSIVTC